MLPLSQATDKFDLKKENKWLVPVGVSNRHVHLSREDIDKLFGTGYQLTVVKELSQIGQFAAKETVNVVGSKGVLEKVRILGPARSQTQIELSRTECVKIGIEPVIRDSGDIADTPGAILIGPKGPQILEKGCIVPRAHIHLDPPRAALLGLNDQDKTSLLIKGNRDVCYQNVLVRVSDTATTDFHIDTDEANAGFVDTGDVALIMHRKAVIKDNFGNVIELNVDNIKFVQAHDPIGKDSLEALDLLSRVYNFPEAYSKNIIEKLQNPALIAPNKLFLLTVIDAGKVIGLSIMYYLAESKMGYLRNIGIIPEFSNRGIGSFLYHKVISLLEKEQPEVEGLLLEVRNNRKTFFLNLGAIPVDTAFYPKSDFNFPEESLLMFKPLIIDASLNTRTLEKAFHDLSKIL